MTVRKILHTEEIQFRLALRRMERKGSVKTHVFTERGRRVKKFMYPLPF